MVAPLSGIRVVEVANWMAAPCAAAVMADMGADVVKVEPLTGDVARGLLRPPKIPDGMPRIDYSFQVDNRGKRSIPVALNEAEGAAIVQRLAAGADVFVCNLLHHRQERYGLDAATLLEANPRLVHATLSGYGSDGPEARRPGYDVTTLHWWPRVCAALGHAEWLDDARFATAKDRWYHMPELTDLIDAAFGTRTLAEWGEIFDEHGLIWGPVATLAELAADPQAAAAGVFPDVVHPDGTFRTVAAPLAIVGADIGPRGPAPELAQHSTEMLTELGFTAEEIAGLAERGVVGLPS